MTSLMVRLNICPLTSPISGLLTRHVLLAHVLPRIIACPLNRIISSPLAPHPALLPALFLSLLLALLLARSLTDTLTSLFARPLTSRFS